MSDRSHKRARTDDPPDQWGSLRQAWNASSLAEEVTELADSNEELAGALETCKKNVGYYKRMYEIAQANYEKYKAGFQKKCKCVEQLKMELKEAKLAEAAAAKAHADDVEQKRQLVEASTTDKEEVISAFTVEVAELKREVAELKRENNEYRGRTKTWRVRYEKLVERGASALASKTMAEYNVTPDEVTLYKNFAAKQAAAARAAEAAREAAVQATQMGLKALTNAE